ncbi:TPA: restriction endonuclease subunit S [Photobacterium damselae]
MVPNGWEHKRLGVVAELQRGFDLPAAKRIDGSVPIISSGGLSGYHNEPKVKAPGIVTGRYGSIGDVFFVENDFWPLNTSLWVKNFHGNEPKYLYYLLTSFDFKKFSDKTGVPGVNRNDLHAVKVGVPPLPEQRKIAQILSTWDRGIATTEKLIDASKQQKKALMQQLLTGKKRLLDPETGKAFQGEWETEQFDKLFDIEIGGTPSRSNETYWDDKLETNNNWLSIADLKGKFISRTKERISDLGVAKSNVSLIPKGTIVMSFKLTIGRRAFLNIDTYTNEAICALLIKNKDKLDNNYLYQALEIVDFEQEIDQAVKGKTLNKAKLKRLKLLMPSVKEQQKIASVLTAADKDIELLEAKLAHLKQEKKALMQQLLTGKRRVNIAEIKVATEETLEVEVA